MAILLARQIPFERLVQVFAFSVCMLYGSICNGQQTMQQSGAVGQQMSEGGEEYISESERDKALQILEEIEANTEGQDIRNAIRDVAASLRAATAVTQQGQQHPAIATGREQGQQTTTAVQQPSDRYVIEFPTQLRVIAGSVVNVRAEPSIRANRIGLLEPGEVVTATGQDGNWYQISLADGREGFVYEELLEEVGGPYHMQGGSGQPSPMSSTPIQQERNSAPRDQPLDAAVEELAKAIEGQFSQPAFQCRQDLDLCRRRQYGWFDCELTMIACLSRAVLR